MIVEFILMPPQWQKIRIWIGNLLCKPLEFQNGGGEQCQMPGRIEGK